MISEPCEQVSDPCAHRQRCMHYSSYFHPMWMTLFKWSGDCNQSLQLTWCRIVRAASSPQACVASQNHWSSDVQFHFHRGGASRTVLFGMTNRLISKVSIACSTVWHGVCCSFFHFIFQFMIKYIVSTIVRVQYQAYGLHKKPVTTSLWLVFLPGLERGDWNHLDLAVAETSNHGSVAYGVSLVQSRSFTGYATGLSNTS